MANFNEDFFINDIDISTDESIFNEEIIETPDSDKSDENKDTKQDNNIITEIDTETLFTDKSEKVSNEKEVIESEGSNSDKKEVLPKTSIYSSFANALIEDNVLTTISSEDLKEIKTSEDFAELITKEVNNQLEESQRRIKEALDYGIEPEAIKSFEGTIKYLDTLTEDIITDESELAIKLRLSLIMQDYINKGFSKERAEREVKKSFDAGTDQEDAKESLDSNKLYFKKEYNKLLEEGKAELEEERKQAIKVREELQKLITSKNAPFEGITLDKSTQQKIYDSISKPIYTDEDGIKYTAIQKYEKENKADFMYKLGVLFTMTDGFKNIDKLVKKQSIKETKSKLKEIEATFQGNRRFSGGSLSLLGGIDDDQESKIGLTLNV